MWEPDSHNLDGVETCQMWVSGFFFNITYRGIELRDASASWGQTGVMESDDENETLV